MINITEDYGMQNPRIEIDGLHPTNILKILKMGFITHSILDPETSPKGMTNDHTHGFPHMCDHPDFQIVMPVSPQISHKIFQLFLDRIKAGEKFKAGQTVKKILQDELEVKLVAATEMGRPLLRIILPDPQGNTESKLPIWGDQAQANIE